MNLSEVPIRKIEYQDIVYIPQTFYETTDILEMSPVQLKFSISKDSNQDDILNLEGSGEMFLEDARTLAKVAYPFQIKLIEKIDEESEMCGRFLTNYQNTLDIMSVLWENIVLEIPISFTISEPLKNDLREDDRDDSINQIDPRLAPLRELLDKEKE